jgi:hypothetical protein
VVEILLLVDEGLDVVRDQGGQLIPDRDPVERVAVQGQATVRLSEQSAQQLARKLLNAAGVAGVWRTQRRPSEDD